LDSSYVTQACTEAYISGKAYVTLKNSLQQVTADESSKRPATGYFIYACLKNLIMGTFWLHMITIEISWEDLSLMF